MTEKDYNPEQKNAKSMKQQERLSKSKVLETKKPEEKTSKIETKEQDEQNKEKKKIVPKKKAPSKIEVAVNAQSVPISTKYSVNICRFIKNKTIEKAISDLEEVMKKKKAVPMRGEYAHKKSVKGLTSGAGRYPIDAAKHFITILKSLRGNANNHNLENPVISEAMANKAQTPFGRFGRWSRKRTHITLKARNKKDLRRSVSPKLRNAGRKKTKVKNNGEKK